jgi:selenium metabolism protein YedF
MLLFASLRKAPTDARLWEAVKLAALNSRLTADRPQLTGILKERQLDRLTATKREWPKSYGETEMAIDEDLLLVIESSGLGDGEPDLGAKLMKAFLQALLQSGDLPARIICMNSGIFLTTQHSPVLDILKGYEKQGSEILSCGTCLAYYGREEQLEVGNPTNMLETVQALRSFKKVLRP